MIITDKEKKGIHSVNELFLWMSSLSSKKKGSNVSSSGELTHQVGKFSSPIFILFCKQEKHCRINSVLALVTESKVTVAMGTWNQVLRGFKDMTGEKIKDRVEDSRIVDP